MLIAIAIGIVGFANAAEPASVIIIIPGAPSDIVLQPVEELASDDAYSDEITKIVRPHEVQFSIYRDYFKKTQSVDFMLSYGETNFNITVDSNGKHLQFFTLDLNGQRLTRDLNPVRVAVIIGLRVAITLLIEGAILYAFGFRERRTWLIFLLINLLTQGFLNIELSRTAFGSGYLLFGLMILEVFILVIELSVFWGIVKEHGWLRRILYPLLANTASLFIGGYLIMHFPA